MKTVGGRFVRSETCEGFVVRNSLRYVLTMSPDDCWRFAYSHLKKLVMP